MVSPNKINRGSEGVKWELGFGQKNNRIETGILNIWENNRLGNGIWAKFGLGKWDLYPPPPPPFQDPLYKLTAGWMSWVWDTRLAPNDSKGEGWDKGGVREWSIGALSLQNFIKPSVFAGSCEFACAEIYAPVCGTDGKTYSNKCSMELEACTQKKNVSVAHNGECSEYKFNFNVVFL